MIAMNKTGEENRVLITAGDSAKSTKLTSRNVLPITALSHMRYDPREISLLS